MESTSTGRSLISSPFYIIVTLVLLVISFVAGGLIDQKLLLFPSKEKELNQLFTTQDATIQGQITRIDGSTLTIKNKAGAIGTLNIIPQSPIFKSNQTTASIDPSSIEVNKDALIFVRKLNNEYRVFMIKYFPLFTKPK